MSSSGCRGWRRVMAGWCSSRSAGGGGPPFFWGGIDTHGGAPLENPLGFCVCRSAQPLSPPIEATAIPNHWVWLPVLSTAAVLRTVELTGNPAGGQGFCFSEQMRARHVMSTFTINGGGRGDWGDSVICCRCWYHIHLDTAIFHSNTNNTDALSPAQFQFCCLME